MNHTKKICVLGAGIAGVTTAIGLKKLGFDVSIINKKRPFRAYEGFSQRTKDGLHMLKCEKAATLLDKQSIRNSNWANQESSINYEFVVNREELDLLLLKDTKNNNIEIINGSVVDIDYKDVIKVSYKNNNETLKIECDFIVDARGRFTPYKSEYTQGPKSFSILQELELSPMNEAKTSIDSIKDGWVWQAYVGEKRGYLQFSCDKEIADKITCFDDVIKYLENQNIDLWTLKNYTLKNKLVKRDSFSKVHKEIINKKMILVGDAAASIDPLSGNGAFQAMSMSSIAAIVVNTILHKKENLQIAIEFYKERVNFIYEKFTKIGKEFYCLEKRFDSDFWKIRQNWPKEIKTLDFEPYVKDGAIVGKDFIFAKKVLVTKENPLGVFFYKNIEIVELAQYCISHSKEDAFIYFEKFIKSNELNKEFEVNLLQWLLSESIISK